MDTNKKFKKTLGLNIKNKRRDMSLSQVGLAKTAKIERSYLGKIERGLGNPSLAKLLAIAKSLKTDLKKLF